MNITLTREQMDRFCREYCRFPIMYCWGSSETVIEGIEKHCQNCILVKEYRYEKAKSRRDRVSSIYD